MTASVAQVKPCKKCGTAERYENGRCKRCAVLRAAAWHKANPEKAREIRAAHRARKPETAASWYARNAEAVRARTAAYRAANPEKVKASLAAWRASNHEAMLIHGNNRRARERASSGRLSTGIAEKLFKLQRGKCACGCKQPLGADYHLDHIMPLARGGTNTDDNVQLLRAKCNHQKHAKHPVDYMQSKGFLI